MPFFVYQKNQDAEIEILSEHPKYKQAKEEVIRLRVNRSEEDQGHEFRMVFAEEAKAAKRLLRTKHEMQSPLQEWEEKIN